MTRKRPREDKRLWKEGRGRMIFLRNVSDDLHRRIRVAAAEEGVSSAELIVRVMDEYTRKKR